MVGVISTLVLLTAFSKRAVPRILYPFVTFVIGLSLLLHWQLVSTHLVGWDVFPEYYIFQITRSNLSWDPTIPFASEQLAVYNSMLSITILPTILSTLLNVEGELTFKVLYPLVFSLVPLVLYAAWRQQISSRAAFLSAFYFMLMAKFYDTSEMRQIVGELFLALLLFVLLKRQLPARRRTMLLIVFAWAILVSHYSLAYIVLFMFLLAWLSGSVTRGRRTMFSRLVNVNMLLIYSAMIFSWYVYVSASPTITLYGFTQNLRYRFFTDFLNLEARGSIVSLFFNVAASRSLVAQLYNVIPKVAYLFMLVGVVDFFWLRRKSHGMKFEPEYASMVLGSIAILSMTILLPGLGPAFITERFFHVTLFFLAPFVVLGGERLLGFGELVFSGPRRVRWIPRIRWVRWLPRKRRLFVVSTLLVVIFLLKVGFVSEVVGDVPTSLALNTSRIRASHDAEIRAVFYSYFISEQDVWSARWLSWAGMQTSQMYGDWVAVRVLEGYGMVNPERIHFLSNETKVEKSVLFYLGYQNVNYGVLTYYDPLTVKEYSLNIRMDLAPLNMTNRIYSNGDGDIHEGP